MIFDRLRAFDKDLNATRRVSIIVYKQLRGFHSYNHNYAFRHSTMATQIIDLTSDCSSDENAANHPRGKPSIAKSLAPHDPAVQRLLQSIAAPSGPARSPCSNVMRIDINQALIEAIDIAKVERLREIVKLACRENQSSRELVEKHLLVPLDKVSRYDIDS